MTARTCQLLVGLLLSLVPALAITANAADVWFYDWREPPAKGARQWTGTETKTALATSADKHWIVTEFFGDPRREQLAVMHAVPGANRVSLLFDRPAAPYLAADYLALAEAWQRAGLEGQFKFVASFPTEQEARILKPLCARGIRIFFVHSHLPLETEAKTLATLSAENPDCVTVDLGIGRYPKYVDILELKKMPAVKLTFTNDYLPAYNHVDNLNLIDNPVALRASRSIPSQYQIDLLNLMKRLTNLTLELDIFPMPEQYGLFAKLDRRDGRRFSIRWVAGPPRAEDAAAWKRLGLSRLQIPLESLSGPGAEERVRTLDGEVVIETFDLARKTPASILLN